VRHEIRGHTAFVTIDNPPANTWTPESLTALEKLAGELAANRSVYAAVITGAGEKFFSAGADLKRFQGDKAHSRQFIQRFGAAFEAWMNARFVTIAAINGYAMGGGLECALSCDIRIAESHAQMALPEPAVGLLPAGCGTQMLPWLVGEGWAKRMILTNERVDAATALRIGLVQEVVDKGGSLAAATALAERVATLSPRSVEFCKSLIHNARNGVAKPEGLQRERERFMDLFEYADTAEGVSAFIEKRKPEWKND
jgi:enoyl-CoA hydratase/carnithine racemase